VSSGKTERREIRRAQRKDRAAGEREAREEYFRSARAHTPILGVGTPSGRFLLSTSDQGLGQKLFVAQRRTEMVLLARLLELMDELGTAPDRGGVFVDVGANIGTTIVPALLDHGFARGLAVEAAPANVELLRCNLLLNGLSGRVLVAPVAASEAAGVVQLGLNPQNWGDNRARPGGVVGDKDWPSVEVRCATLDSLAADDALEGVRPGMLWIDAQGHEGHIAAGATTTLSTGVPFVLELWPPMLEKTGGWELLENALTENYTHILDLRAGLDSAPRPVAELGEVAAGLESFTDLLALRLPAGRIR
jgi:FkbM family methyltransferase